jgi:hypothetical protein
VRVLLAPKPHERQQLVREMSHHRRNFFQLLGWWRLAAARIHPAVRLCGRESCLPRRPRGSRPKDEVDLAHEASRSTCAIRVMTHVWRASGPSNQPGFGIGMANRAVRWAPRRTSRVINFGELPTATACGWPLRFPIPCRPKLAHARKSADQPWQGGANCARMRAGVTGASCVADQESSGGFAGP